MKSLTDISPRLDPALVDLFLKSPIGLDLESGRHLLKTLCLQLADALPGPKPTMEDVEIPGTAGAPPIPMRIFRPAEGGSDTILYWIHGGGFIAGDHTADALVAIPFVQESGCTVVSVGYRLAPEHRAPAAFNDCYAGFCWTAENAAKILGKAPRKLAVGGMSAGGCLAASLVLAARDRGGPKSDFQLLLIPVLDNRHQTPSSFEIEDMRVWCREKSIAAWTMYAGTDFLTTVPDYTAPALASDLSGLPPTFIEISEIDLLRDEAIEFGARLMQAGVTVEMHVYPGAYHASSMIQPNVDVSRSARRDIFSALKRALQG